MERRAFIKSLAVLGAGSFLGRFLAACTGSPGQPAAVAYPTAAMPAFDAHAHPGQFFSDRPQRIDPSASLDSIRAAGVTACSFAAVGDLVSISPGQLSGSEAAATRHQLAKVQRWIAAGNLNPVTKSADLAHGGGALPGAMLAVEGGDCLGSDIGQVAAFYDLGVRSIGLVHYTINAIGDICTQKPKHGGLTAFGRQVVARMQDLGMIVDVAHAHPLTLKEVADLSSRPIMDSHTNPAPIDDPAGSDDRAVRRMRSWKEMEWVAKTGGIVCTWPLRHTYGQWRRETLADWAREIVQMKSRLGIDHVALGTDGGGMVPRRIDSYRDYRDLHKLAAAMEAAGLSADDIHAYMRGNVMRVFKSCCG
jgi:membrane dipeptidase